MRRSVILLVILMSCLSLRLPGQTFETQKKPPAVVFKDAAGTVVTSIPIDTRDHVPVVEVSVSVPSNRAYVLNGSGKSAQRSISAVSLATQKVDRVIGIGGGNEVELVMSADGRHMFSQTLRKAIEELGRQPSEHLQKREGSSSLINVVDTSSNQVVSSYDLLNTPGAALPESRFVETFLSVSPDGERVLAKIDGFEGRVVRTGSPSWVRLLVFSINSAKPILTFDPGAPIVSYKFSQDGNFLFVAAEDKERRSERVHVINLEKGTTLNRMVEDPPSRREKLGTFIDGAAPSGMESKHGIWVVTARGLRFVSETGEIGNEVEVPFEENSASQLSLDRTFLFVTDTRSEVLHVIDLKKGTHSTHPLSDVPTRMVRLGPANQLWIVGSREMRAISEVGELGERPILLNKAEKTEAEGTDSGNVFLDGYPWETISVGDDHAAMLIANRKGSSLHRVALIDLKSFRLESVVATMSKAEQSKIVAGRFAESVAIVALAARTSPIILPRISLANEFLTVGRDGRSLYVLDTDNHTVSMIDVPNASVLKRIPVNDSVTTIGIDREGKNLLCAGPGFLQTISLETAN
jgi:DNA-binding beta-propeller fold protein YncE